MKYKIRTLTAIIGRLVIGSVYPPLGRKAEYFLNASMPNLLNAPPDMVRLRRKGAISDDYFYKVMEYQGLDKQRADEVYSLSEKLYELEELVSLRLRGEIDLPSYIAECSKIGISEWNAEKLFSLASQRLPPEAVIKGMWRKISFGEGDESYKNELRAQGWEDERISVLEKTARFYPSVDDFIRFLVRETFRPDVIAKYGYDEDYPKEIEDFVAKAGIDPEWMKHFWRAHWILPTPTMVYEMLHRGVITKEEMLDLLKVADYPKFWREKLVAISYTPYTRVDIRRMHKVGVLDREGVKKAYKEIGYDEEKSEKMTEFTIRLNEEPEDSEMTDEDKRKKELKGLTISTIIKEYKNELISENDTRKYLRDLGLTDEVIDAQIGIAEYEKESDRVDTYLTAYKRMYLNGVIDYNTASDLLDKLNLPASNKEYLLDIWDLEKMGKPSLPSKTELESFYKKGIIDQDTYKIMMRNLGYDDTFIDWYLEAMAVKAK
jgi:hypothetical protein